MNVTGTQELIHGARSYFFLRRVCALSRFLAMSKSLGLTKKIFFHFCLIFHSNTACACIFLESMDFLNNAICKSKNGGKIKLEHYLLKILQI